MSTKDKNIIESVIYNYTNQNSAVDEENRILRETVKKLQRELEVFRDPPLMVCEVYHANNTEAIIKIPNGNQFNVKIAAGVGKLSPGDTVLAEQKNLTVVKKISVTKKFNVEQFVILEKPKETWKDVGGHHEIQREIQEVVELPLKSPELFRKVGIKPPKGILLYGEPGTGKTLLAKAVANATNSTFIEIVGSELVQKFIGEGAKLVKEIFELAREKSPAVIFIDEIDALASKRVEIGTSGEREVNRTFMQLLAEIDGFRHLADVKVIGATNRKDILDPAITRPGRLDRLINVPLPDKPARKEIFRIHTKNMQLDRGIKIDRIMSEMENLSGAEIRAVCTEAGYFAIRENRSKIFHHDFIEAVKKVRESESREGNDYLRMFG